MRLHEIVPAPQGDLIVLWGHVDNRYCTLCQKNVYLNTMRDHRIHFAEQHNWPAWDDNSRQWCQCPCSRNNLKHCFQRNEENQRRMECSHCREGRHPQP